MQQSTIHAESSFLGLFYYEVSLRYLLPIVCFYAAASLSLYASAVLFYFCSALYIIYTILDAYDLIVSTRFFWLSKHRDFRKGCIDLLLCLLQFGLSLIITFCFFSNGSLFCGILSPEVAPNVHKLYKFVVEHIFHSGFLLGSIFVRQSLQTQKFNFISSFLMDQDSASIMAFGFSAMVLGMKFPFLLGFIAVPYVFISAFYCLDIISNLISLKAFSGYSSSNTLEPTVTKTAILMLHAVSFGLWSSVFGISLQLSFISLPVIIAEGLMRHTPQLLLIPVQNITSNMIFTLSTLSVLSEYMRDFIYKHSSSNCFDVSCNNNSAKMLTPSYFFKRSTTNHPGGTPSLGLDGSTKGSKQGFKH